MGKEIPWRRYTGREIAWKANTLWRVIFWEKYPEEGNSMGRKISLGAACHRKEDALGKKRP